MDLTPHVKQAEKNHRSAMKKLQAEMRQLHPGNIAPGLARQAVVHDTKLSYLTLQTWLRGSDQDLSDLDQN